MHLILINKNVVTCTLKLLIRIYVGDMKFCSFWRKLRDIVKVSKGAKIRNRYNQVSHLTQNTNGKVCSPCCVVCGQLYVLWRGPKLLQGLGFHTIIHIDIKYLVCKNLPTVFTLENQCTGTAQSSRVGCSRRGTNYTFLGYCGRVYEQVLNNY